MMLQLEVDSLYNLLYVKASQGKNCWTAKSNLCLGLLFLVTARISIRLKDLKLCRKGRVRNLMVTLKILCFIYRFEEASFFSALRKDGQHASGLLDILALRSAFKHPPLIKHNNANISPSFIADILWSYSGLKLDNCFKVLTPSFDLKDTN